MTFSEFINEYKNKLGCSFKDISDVTGLTPATISRYKSGERVPVKNGPQYQAIVRGFILLAEKTGKGSKDDIVRDIESAFKDEDDSFDFYGFRRNLSEIMDRLHITLRDVADAVDKDVSYISRIKAGTRHPASPGDLVSVITGFICNEFTKRYQLEIIAELLDLRLTEVSDENARYDHLYNWLYSDDESMKRYVDDFVHKLDKFNLNEYVSSANVGRELEEASSRDFPGGLSYNLEDVLTLQRSLIQKTIKESQGGTLDICWNMSNSKMNKTYISSDQLIQSLAQVLKKGVRIRIVNINSNPMNEMIDWLDNWLPLNMTGQIEFYYLDRTDSDVFINSLMVSDVAALTSEGLSDNKDIYRSYVTENKFEVDYYRRKFEGLIDLSEKMIDVIGADNNQQRKKFLKEDMKTAGKRTNILSTPPIYTISDELLRKILRRNDISAEDGKRIQSYIHNERDRVLSIMEHSRLEDHIPEVSRIDYDKKPVFLSLSGLFYDKDIFYTYDEYIEHLSSAQEFQDKYENYSLIVRNDLDYRNIQIFIHENEWVMISKNKSPAIHFIVRHPVMRRNLEEMLEAIAR